MKASRLRLGSDGQAAGSRQNGSRPIGPRSLRYHQHDPAPEEKHTEARDLILAQWVHLLDDETLDFLL
jgi:hypothetical protein